MQLACSLCIVITSMGGIRRRDHPAESVRAESSKFPRRKQTQSLENLVKIGIGKQHALHGDAVELDTTKGANHTRLL